MVIESAGVGNECLRLDNLHIAGFLIPEVAEHVGGGLQQRRCLVGFALFNQQFDDEHGSLLHGDAGILRQWKLTEQLLQRVLLGGIKRSGR